VRRLRPVEVSLADALPGWALRRYETTLILTAWLVFAVIFTGNRLVASIQAGVPIPFRIAATVGFAMAAVWATNTIIIFSLSRRFALDRRPRAARILIHMLAAIVISAIQSSAEAIIGILTGALAVDNFMAWFFAGIPFNVIVYWLIVGVAHGMMFYRRYRQRDAEAAVLASRLANAELEVLKSQLHPHFLFNAMNTISALMHRDVKAADRMLARLSELLRAALDHTSEQEVSLSDELNFLESYLEIEQTRFGERLHVEVDVPPNVLDAVVPHMIMQPLVENAIRHGVAPRAAVGTVTIRARGRRDMLDLEVLDDGPGVPPGRSPNGGLGLANVKARLQQLYGERFSFEPRNRAEGGFRVTMSIPFRPMAADDPEE
jgi:two-component system, LytTR family, sensor kinase